MKMLFLLMVIAGLGFWIFKETEHEKELQAELDEARQGLNELQNELHPGHATQTPAQLSQQRKSGSGTGGQWMWGKSADGLKTDSLRAVSTPSIHTTNN